MNVLKIDSSGRQKQSNSRVLTQYLAEQLDHPVVSRDLSQNPLPAISADDLIGVHGSKDDDRDSLKQHLALSNTLIDELMNSDILVIGMPIYNFSVPATLKQWIDFVCRAGVTFRYTENGPEGLTNINKAFIVTASGGTPIGSDMDFASRYMEQICRFIGVKEVIHIDAGGSKREPEQIIAQGKQQIDAALAA